MFTKAGQQRLILLPLFLLGRLGDNSPSWRHIPSITHKKKNCVSSVCSKLQIWQTTGTAFLLMHPLQFSSRVPSVCLLEFDLVHSDPRLPKNPGWLTWSGLFSAISTLPSLSVYLPVAVIFTPLSSGSKYRSSSGPISISRGPHQQIGKANTDIQSLSWTLSW